MDNRIIGRKDSGKYVKYGIPRGDLDCNRNRNGILPQKREDAKQGFPYLAFIMKKF